MNWEHIAAALLVGVLVILFLPGLRKDLKNTPKGTSKDWMSALIPIGLVVLFVILLILLV